MANNIPLANGTKLSDYTLVRRISNGGMGMVYLARTNAGKPVVVKEYLPQHLNLRKNGARVQVFDAKDQKSFEAGMNDFFRENEVLSKIEHPNVVKVIDSFQMHNTAYSVMEYIYGQSLQHVIQAEGGPGLKEKYIRRIFMDVLSGVGWLHQNRILHLDIKPSNIYVTHKGEAMLLDFGTAWLLDYDAPEKRSKPPMHTPGFAPPEQYKSYYDPNRVGPQTDIYALGCSMYACLKGAPPPTSLRRIDEGEHVSAQMEWMGDYSPWLLEVIDHLMILEWDRRIKTTEKVWKIFESAKPNNQENKIHEKLQKMVQKTLDF
jgi:serine/threonine protein kinase